MIRPYVLSDREVLIALLKSNVPRYFAQAEVEDFVTYLDYHQESYFVVEVDGKIMGSGGINYFPDEGMARLSWDLIHPDFQGQGLGKALTLFRINEIKNNTSIHTVVVRTSQLVYTFYQKSGFELMHIVKDFWAEGFDLYQMHMVLSE